MHSLVVKAVQRTVQQAHRRVESGWPLLGMSELMVPSSLVNISASDPTDLSDFIEFKGQPRSPTVSLGAAGRYRQRGRQPAPGSWIVSSP
jgi:hypothetical protein